MRFLALITDYDGTLAHHGVVADETVEALQRLRQSGRKLVLVTGREMPDLERVFPHLNLFDRIVAENGAVLVNPTTRDTRVLAERPPDEFIAELKARNVTGLSKGEVIVATWHPHETVVLETIRRLGLDLQVIFNKDAVMVLPAGVNKMTGLNQALKELKLSRRNIAGVGDAENDLAFLNCCECAVGVANALPAIKERADLVTQEDHGAGVVSLISRIIEDDLKSVDLPLEKHGILFGRIPDRDIYIGTEGRVVLLSGPSGSGKSTFVAGLVERIEARDYQVCVIDPEGDYEKISGFITLGNEQRPPSFEEILQVLEEPDSNLVVNLVGAKMQDRPHFFASLLTKLQEKRLRDGRPHWIIIEEAHHLLPSEWAPTAPQLAAQTASLVFVTVHPEHMSPAALRMVNTVAAVGIEPQKVLAEFASVVHQVPPELTPGPLSSGEAAVWFLDSNTMVDRMQSVQGKAERKRHRRKYAEGELEPERVFYFRGPEGKMNLRAQNLLTFLQLAEGVDDETWLYHLRRADYSTWLALAIKDSELAEQIRQVEQDNSLSPMETRREISKAVEAKYTAPA